MKTTRKPKVKESDIQKTILDWLAWKRIFHYRQNSGALPAKGGFVRYGTPGAPDIVVVIGGRYIGIEVKRLDGKLSTDQVTFAKNISMVGGKYIVARRLEDISEHPLFVTVDKNKKQ